MAARSAAWQLAPVMADATEVVRSSGAALLPSLVVSVEHAQAPSAKTMIDPVPRIRFLSLFELNDMTLSFSLSAFTLRRRLRLAEPHLEILDRLSEALAHVGDTPSAEEEYGHPSDAINSSVGPMDPIAMLPSLSPLPE